MYKTISNNFMCRCMDKIYEIINSTKADRVVWIGIHHWIGYIYSALLEFGVKEFEVVDNDVFKQGMTYCPYKKYCSNDDSDVICVKDLRDIKIDNDTLFLMANTHYEELCDQLMNRGVRREKIIDLYQYTLGYADFWKEQRSICKDMTLLTIKEIQRIALDILKELKRFCNAHNLRYYLGGGTLLGAVRHNGFIPWDDDIDVYMPYEDYRKFVEIYPNKGKYYALDWKSDACYYLPFGQLVDTSTYLLRDYPGDGYCRMSVFIDIFPISGYPSNINSIKEKWQRNLELDCEWYWYYIMKDMKKISIEDNRQKIEEERHRYLFDDSEFVGNCIRTRQRPWVMERGIYDSTIEIQFEDDFFTAPAGYEEYLSYRYGDYMKLPLLKDRYTHQYPAFKK